VFAAGCGTASSNASPPVVATAAPSQEALVLTAELVVARDILRGYRQFGVVVDSLFAVPEQAPGSSSAELRPPARAAALRDSLRYDSGSMERGTLVLHLSKPRIVDGVARITATVAYPSERARGRRGYETVDYTLDLDGGSWAIRTRVQLGIS
jgi:hypothetical protein